MQRVSRLGVFLALLIGVPLLQAQRGMSGGMSAGMSGGMGRAGAAPVAHSAGMGTPHGVPPHNPGGVNPGSVPGSVGFHHHHGFRNNGFGNGVFLGSPFWGGPFWDDGEQVVYEQPPAQPQPAAVQQKVVEPIRPPAEPLMIEWQGDRYVRSGGSVPGQQNQIAAERDYSAGSRSGAGTKTASTALPPAVLAFRNGTREEVNSYTIIGKTLYASGDYWTQGYWTKKVQLADLDLPQTIRLNQERGVPFKLPRAPNDIVTRP